jgi:hypothetical protein
MFSLKLKMNDTNKILKDHGMQENGPVVKCLRDTVYRFCDPYVPYSGNGSGMKSQKTYPNNHSIRYEGPYAHYVYKAQLMVSSTGSSWAKKGEKKHYTNKSLKFQGAPKRGGEWEKRMMNDRRKDVIKSVQNFIKKGGK